jgi:hypothetical protein
MPGFPLERIEARSTAERLRGDKRTIYLNSLDQFARPQGVGRGLVAFEDAI